MKLRVHGCTQVFISIVICSCGSLTKLPEADLEPGSYEMSQGGSDYSIVHAKVSQDTVSLILPDKSAMDLKHNHVLRKKAFDFDLLIVPFKYRQAISNLPNQLTTDFNGNLFFGYRIDRYKSHITETPGGPDQFFRHHAITLGAFGGFGTTFIGPSTTNNQTTDEYSGLVFTRGVSTMVGIKNLTVGVGIGWDFLADRDKDIWIYQNKPWLGLMLSLNLN